MSTKKISYREYQRRVFNTLLTECFVKLHAMANGMDECSSQMESYPNGSNAPQRLVEMANNSARIFFRNEMDLDKCTITETKNKLKNATTFVKDCVALCEEAAEEKAEFAKEQKLELTDDDKAEEVGEEEKSEIGKLFAQDAPTVTADVVAKASVDALMQEKEKSEEIKDAIDLAKAAGETDKLEEAVTRLSKRGPTSLMNAIMTAISEAAVKDVNNYDPHEARNVGNVLRDNKDEIRNRSLIMYSLYETISAFGFKSYTPREVKNLAWDIYQGK